MTEETEVNVGTIEDRARRMGHVPKEEFRGKPENWVDAETYVRLAEESLPILKGTLKTMEQKMAGQERAIKAQTEAMNEKMSSLQTDMAEFVEYSKGAEQRAYTKAMNELKAAQRKAKDAGDIEAFAEATDKIDSLIAEHPTVTGKEKPATTITEPAKKPAGVQEQFQQWMASDPEAFDEWKGEHKWYLEEPDMFAYAQQMDQFLINNKHIQNGFKMSRRDHLAEVTKLVKKKFPDFFGNPARKGGSPVEGDSGGSPGGNGKQSYNDLPADARAKCDKWTGRDGKGTSGTIPGLTRQQYVKDYFM